MRVKFLEVLGGYMSGDSKDENSDGKRKVSSGTFMVKKSVIVRESDLSGLMRRDWELCSMPVIKIRETNSRPVNELPVRYDY
jgi:hypothetical protein